MTIYIHQQTLKLNRATQQFCAELCLISASLSQLKNQTSKFLHAEELDYFKSLSFAKKQHSYLLGRYSAKLALSNGTIGPNFKSILIKPGVFEYPVVNYPNNPKNIQLSISHSELLGAALAFPESHPMGIDLEIIKPNNKVNIATQLTVNESQWIESCSYTPVENLYTLLWTIKEALSKVLRTGFMTPFEIYEVKNTVWHDNYWISEFKNFAQYQAISFKLNQYFFSIVYPCDTELKINLTSINQWISEKK